MTDGSFLFDPGTKTVRQGITLAERDIRKENAQVVRRGHYVTVALLTPLTWSASSLVSLARVRDELEGAFVAQYNANVIENVSPRIRLLLANEGSQEQAWQQTVRQLEQLTTGPHPLAAVIGMGVSTTQTLDAARALHAAGIPMVGSVITADGFDWSHIAGLARVAPSNSQEVAALTGYLTAHGGLGRDFLAYDNEAGDYYTANFASDFRFSFGHHIVSQDPYGPGPQIGNEFSAVAENVCAGSGVPPAVLYAGREVVLAQFISQLQSAPDCAGKRITVLTGSDAAALPPSYTAVSAGRGPQTSPAAVSVIYSALTNPANLTVPFRRLFLREFGTRANGLSDSWMIKTNDALAAVARAIGIAAGASASLPGKSAIWDTIGELNGTSAVQGATGPFSIDPVDGQEAAPDIPIFGIADGSERLLSP